MPAPPWPVAEAAVTDPVGPINEVSDDGAILDVLARLAARLTATSVAVLWNNAEGPESFTHCTPTHADGNCDSLHAQVFCSAVATQRLPLVVADVSNRAALAKDPAIAGLGIAAYIGFPLFLDGIAIGALCAMQSKPRNWTQGDIEAMQDFAVIATTNRELRAAREMLASRDENLYDLLEHATDMIVRISSDGSILYANKAALVGLGYASSELLGKQASEIVAPESRPAYSVAAERIVREGHLEDFSAELITGNGARIVAQGSGNCQYQYGRPISSRLVFKDVTLKQRLKEEVELIEHAASGLSEGEDLAGGLGDVLARVSEYGRWDAASAWVAEGRGQAPRSIATWTRPDLSLAGSPPLTGAATEWNVLMEAATHGRGPPGSSHIRSTGGAGGSEGTMVAVPMMSGEDCRGLLAFWSAADKAAGEEGLEVLTAVATQIEPLLRRRLAEEALRASEARYRHLIETAQEGVWMLTPDARTSYANKRLGEILGYSIQEMIGRSLFDFVHPRFQASATSHFEECGKGGTASSECCFSRKDGSDCWALVSASPILDSAGHPEGTLALVTDITLRKSDQTQLQLRERQLAEAQEVARMGSWDWDMESGRLTGSEGLYRVLGLPTGTPLTYELLLRHVAKEDVGRLKTALLDSVHRREPLSIEYQIVDSGGHVRSIYSRGDFYRNEADESVRMAGVVQDITERKTAENEIRRTAQIIDLANDAVIIRGLDGVVSYWNRGAEQIYGWGKEEATGRICSELLDNVEPDTGDSPTAIVLRAGRWAGELVQRDKSGRRLQMDGRWTLLRDNDESIGVLEINSDVTERHRVRQLFGAVLDAATDYSIIGTDLDGMIHTFNAGAERMLGYEAGEMIGKATPMLIHAPEEITARALQLGMDPGFEVLVANAQTGSGETREWTYVGKDGGTIPVSLTVTAMRNEAGQETGFIAIAVDITERKAVEQAMLALKETAELSAKTKSEFLANMSHEIRTPMNGITGMTELLLDTDLTTEQRDYLELVQVSAQSLLRIIDDILDFSRIDAGKLRLEPHPFDLRHSLHQTLRTLELRATNKGIRLHHEVGQDVPNDLIGDLGRLRQVIVNLVDNAIKFTQSGEVRVAVKAGEAEPSEVVLRIEVTDTGIGIPADRQWVIMDPFTQADSSTTRRYGGSGLGLAISRSLVEMMGGKLWVESVEGEGSCFGFTVRLKRAPADRKIKGKANGSKPGKGRRNTGRPLRILVAEDNLINQRVAVALLEKEGHDVTVAENGLEAVRLSGQRNFDAILMDVQMPELNGFEATRIIRARESTTEGRVPIIGVTAHALPGDADRCIESGMDDYCGKPVQITELDAILRRVVTARRKSGADDGRSAVDQDTTAERRASIVAALGGDSALFDELAAIFLQDSPGVISSLEAAVQAADGQAVVHHAHKLRGSAAVFEAGSLADSTLRLQEVGRRRWHTGEALRALEAVKRAYVEFSGFLTRALMSPGSESALRP